MMKDSQQDLNPETTTDTEVYCPKTETVHSAGEVCDGWHLEWWKQPDWTKIGPGMKMCRRCGYTNMCRCFWCGRCNNVTGNSNQGHYWAYCGVTKSVRDFHFCCPDNCELEVV